MSNPLFRWISRFWSPPKGEQIDLSRRTAITTGLAGFFGALFVKIMPDSGQKTYNPALVRPPGSLAEEEFLGKCVRCGECMKVCPTNCIQPAQLQAGMEGQWTPVMDYTIGNCEYECSLCGQVCPTGAIVPLTLQEKKKVKIGTAFFDTNRCLPYAFQRMCIVCEEHCPIPDKAIWTEIIEVKNRKGEMVQLKKPHVDPDLCIGCGLCQYSCPISDKEGIYVTSVGESRHEDNQMLLQSGFGGGIYGGNGENMGGSDPYGGSGGDPYAN